MQVKIENGTVRSVLKRQFCFSGRSTRKEFWLTALALLGVQLVIGAIYGCLALIGLDAFAAFLSILLFLVVVVAAVANVFRRIHDLGLSGFWMWYLSFFGLPFLYIAHIMDSDESAKNAVNRISNVGSPWLSWVLAIIFWPLASTFGLLIVLLSKGQEMDNKYGANPYL